MDNLPFLLLSLSLLISVCLLFLAESVHDIRASPHAQPKPHGRSSLRVSVILYCHNSEKTLETAISSIMNSTNQNIDLIFINNASIDGTAAVLRKSKKAYPNSSIKIITKRRAWDEKAIIKYAIDHKATGQLLFIQRIPHSFDHNALTTIAGMFKTDKQLGALQINTDQQPAKQLKNIAEFYASADQKQALKLTRNTTLSTLMSRSAFVIRRHLKPRTSYSARYTDEVILSTLGDAPRLPLEIFNAESAQLFQQNNKFYRIVALLLPIQYIAILILALFQRSPSIFIFGWLVFTASFVLHTLSNGNSSLIQRVLKLRHFIIGYMLYCIYHSAKTIHALSRTTMSPKLQQYTNGE